MAFRTRPRLTLVLAGLALASALALLTTGTSTVPRPTGEPASTGRQLRMRACDAVRAGDFEPSPVRTILAADAVDPGRDAVAAVHVAGIVRFPDGSSARRVPIVAAIRQAPAECRDAPTAFRARSDARGQFRIDAPFRHPVVVWVEDDPTARTSATPGGPPIELVATLPRVELNVPPSVGRLEAAGIGPTGDPYRIRMLCWTEPKSIEAVEEARATGATIPQKIEFDATELGDTAPSIESCAAPPGGLVLAQVTGLSFELAHAFGHVPHEVRAIPIELPMRVRRLDTGVRVQCEVPPHRVGSRLLFEVATLDLLHTFWPYDGDPPLLPAGGCVWLPPGRYRIHVHLWADGHGPQVSREHAVTVPQYGLAEIRMAFGVTPASK